MVEPISTGISVAITLLVKNAPTWLPVINDALISPMRDALISKGTERALDKLGEGRTKIFRLDEKEQARHLELAMKNAGERGLARLHTKKEQEQYCEVITTLANANSDSLRRVARRLLFTLTDSPDLTELNILYNQLHFKAQSPRDKVVDATHYLSNFFNALTAELYSDPYFRQQMSDVLQVRTGLNMQRSLAEVITTLRQMGGILAGDYTPEQFEKDVRAYTEHIERTLRYLKLVGVVPKERTNENKDPELDGIFVPLRIDNRDSFLPNFGDSIIDFLEHTTCMVLLGGPGLGKSTATRHLAWSHAAANLPNLAPLTKASLLSGKPLPLRIELRRLNEDRKQRPGYGFLTYASEVILGRVGVNIPIEMFKQLLERKMMLILFDGLDEVATLDNRRTLVEEIESFAQCYPGNRFLVTSRPVGYDLAPLSKQVFFYAKVESFDDQQIHLFLEHWYTHVMRLTPLSPDNQDELEELYTTLKDNPRLHSLAENPLLLTVITALHRYERLPDRRILVYNRCADLLLETWAKLKGTNSRWDDLKLSKEDQYACVAHLGFALHGHLKEEQDGNIYHEGSNEVANDVPLKFMLREIEHFLDHQHFFPSKAEQHAQAKRFLELIQEEAGLIVERGTDENGELLYGFVHRTFQEYFAAADVYERYQQEEDPTIISEFLGEHLHNPLWREVILLLFGKLKRKPATVQLRQILDGKIKNPRNATQEALFFVSSCLIEEISIENDLAEAVILQLGDLVKKHPFPTSPSKALEALGTLMLTRQCALLARQEIKALIDQDLVGGTSTKIAAITILLQNSDPISEEHQTASELLVQLAQSPGLSVKQTIQTIESLFLFSLEGSEIRRTSAHLLVQLAQRPDLPVGQFIQTILNFHRFSLEGSETRQVIIQLLLQLAQRPDLPVEQSFYAAYNLQRFSLEGSEIRRTSAHLLVQLAQRPDLPVGQFIQTILNFHRFSLEGSMEYQTAIQMLSQLAQLPDFPIGHIIQAVEILLMLGFEGPEEHQIATQLLLQLAQHPGLPVEKTIQAALNLHLSSKFGSMEERIAIQLLLQLAQHPGLPVDQAIQILNDLVLFSLEGSEEQQLTAQLLLQLVYRPDLSIDQAIQVALNLARVSSKGSKDYLVATQLLLQLAQRSDIPTEQSFQAALNLRRFSAAGSIEEQTATQLLLQLARRPHYPPIEYTIHIVSNLCRLSPKGSEDCLAAVRFLLELAHRSYIPTHERLRVITALLKMELIKYADRIQMIQVALDLLQKEEAIQYFEVHWQLNEQTIEPEVSDIPLLAKLTRDERLPSIVRNDLYQALRRIVLQFSDIAEESIGEE